jgi:hypothetical protein
MRAYSRNTSKPFYSAKGTGRATGVILTPRSRGAKLSPGVSSFIATRRQTASFYIRNTTQKNFTRGGKKPLAMGIALMYIRVSQMKRAAIHDGLRFISEDGVHLSRRNH